MQQLSTLSTRNRRIVPNKAGNEINKTGASDTAAQGTTVTGPLIVKTITYIISVDLPGLRERCIQKFGIAPRPFQLRATESVLCGKDCWLNVPTGGGKTLSFYLPLLVIPNGIILVASPLTALMKDQVSALAFGRP